MRLCIAHIVFDSPKILISGTVPLGIVATPRRGGVLLRRQQQHQQQQQQQQQQHARLTPKTLHAVPNLHRLTLL